MGILFVFIKNNLYLKTADGMSHGSKQDVTTTRFLVIGSEKKELITPL